MASSNSSTRGTTTGYYYSANHVYAIRATNAAAAVTIELQLGDDSKAVGDTWTTTPTDSDGLLFRAFRHRMVIAQ